MGTSRRVLFGGAITVLAIGALVVSVQRGAASVEESQTRVSAPSPTDAAAAARDASRAVMARKAEFVAACWTPLLKNNPQQTSSRHMIRVTFDADGAEVERAVDGVPGKSRSDVTECLRSLPGDLEAPASGRPVAVTVALAFP